MNIERKYNVWNENLRLKYEDLWSDAKYHIWDGVVSPNDYVNSYLKIMFLNRESFDDPNNGGYDISQGIAKEFHERKPILGGENSSMMKNTKNRLAVLRLLERDIRSFDENMLETAVSNYTTDCFREEMQKVAYCNIKKTDGTSKSTKKDLRVHFNKNKDIIEEQIIFFNPSLIVGGNIVDGILDNLEEWGDNLYTSHYVNIYQIKIRNILFPFIDMYHPSWWALDLETDRKELLKALKHVDNHYPNYWKNRCDQKCFISSGSDIQKK